MSRFVVEKLKTNEFILVPQKETKKKKNNKNREILGIVKHFQQSCRKMAQNGPCLMSHFFKKNITENFVEKEFLTEKAKNFCDSILIAEVLVIGTIV